MKKVIEFIKNNKKVVAAVALTLVIVLMVVFGNSELSGFNN